MAPRVAFHRLIIVQHRASAEWTRLDKRATTYLQAQSRKRREAERKRKTRELEAATEAARDAMDRIRKSKGLKTSDTLDAVPPPSVPPPSDDFLRTRFSTPTSLVMGLGVSVGNTKYATLEEEDYEHNADLDDWRLRESDPKLFRFLQIRERFVYGLKGCEGKKYKLASADTFKLGAYLRVCSADITASLVHIHPITWALVAVSLGIVYVCNANMSHTATCIVLVLWGWVNVALLVWARHTLEYVIAQLSPPPTTLLQSIREGDPYSSPEYLHCVFRTDMTQHDQLWPLGLGSAGPAFYAHLVRTVTLTCAVYVIGVFRVSVDSFPDGTQKVIVAGFLKEMMDEPGILRWLMVVASFTSVLVSVYMFLPLFAPLVMAQKIGLHKDIKVVERVYREQQLNTSIQLLQVLKSMQAHSRQLKKMAMNRQQPGAEQRSAAEIEEEQRKALEYFEEHPNLKRSLTEAFTAFDSTKNGNIDSKELYHLLRSLGQNFTQAEADSLLCVRPTAPLPWPASCDLASFSPCRGPQAGDGCRWFWRGVSGGIPHCHGLRGGRRL